MCICNKQIKETEHSSLKNSQGIWESHEKVVRHLSSETAWALKDGRSPPLRVLGGASADELPMTIVGLASALLHSGMLVCTLSATFSLHTWCSHNMTHFECSG